jgi:predicted flap endonuclease-1-like 5' DNA nuclease
MPFTTPEQVLLLAILLLGGWLLGYASAPNVKTWKRKVRAQSDSFTAYHRDAEDRLRAAQQRAVDLKNEVDALRADHADAERTIARLRATAAAPTPTAKTVKVWAPVLQVPEPESAVPAATVQDAAVMPEGASAAAEAPFPDSQADHGTRDDAAAVSTQAAAAPQDRAQAAPFVAPAPTEAESDGFSRRVGGTLRNDLTRIRGINADLSIRLFSLGVVRFEDIEKLSCEDELSLEQRLGLPADTIAREQWRSQAKALRLGRGEETRKFTPVTLGV